MSQTLVGKTGKAKNGQYKMDLGKGFPAKQSYKKKVKPFQEAEDSTDEAYDPEDIQEGTNIPVKQLDNVQSKGGNLAHKKMHQMMDKMEDPASHSNDRHKNRPNFGKKPRNSKTQKLSMF